LSWATYFGGDASGGVAVDASDDVYLTGSTGANLPVTSGAFQTKSGGYGTGFVAKLSSDATKLIYSTYLGGTPVDFGTAIAVDANGEAYVAGSTDSTDFPMVQAIQNGPYWESCTQWSQDGLTPVGAYYCASGGFVSALNPQGSALSWSTYMGSGPVGGIALDPSGNVLVAGRGIDITHPNGAGVVKIAQQGSPLQFSWQAITNGASFNPGLPAPGGLATLFVSGLNLTSPVNANGFPLPVNLAGISILVNGTPAPILTASSDKSVGDWCVSKGDGRSTASENSAG
jgi:hypothetical protein